VTVGCAVAVDGPPALDGFDAEGCGVAVEAACVWVGAGCGVAVRVALGVGALPSADSIPGIDGCAVAACVAGAGEPASADIIPGTAACDPDESASDVWASDVWAADGRVADGCVAGDWMGLHAGELAG